MFDSYRVISVTIVTRVYSYSTVQLYFFYFYLNSGFRWSCGNTNAKLLRGTRNVTFSVLSPSEFMMLIVDSSIFYRSGIHEWRDMCQKIEGKFCLTSHILTVY